MSKIVRKVARVALTLALVAGTARAQETTLQILSVNDTHSNLEAGGPKDADLQGTVGGLPKAATVIAQLRAAEPNTLFLHAGDLFFGDVYFNATLGSSELRILASLGLDAMAAGNHEFWMPAPVLAAAYQAAFAPDASGQAPTPFPVLCANVVPDPALPFVVPGIVRDVGGVKVGIVGVVTPFDLPEQANARFLGADDPPYGILGLVGAQVARIRQVDGAQVVVLLSHLGVDLDRAIAANVPGVNAIVGGHDHYDVAETVNGVPIVHAGAYYREVGRVRLSIGASGVAVLSRELVPVDASVPRLPPVAAAVSQVQDYVRWIFAPYLDEAKYGLYFRTPIATATADVTNLDGDGAKRDTGLGNLVTDAMRLRTGTDVAFTANGQTPQGIAAGPIVAEDLFRVVGDGFDARTHFGWKLVTFSITGAEIWKALETTIAYSLADHDYGIQVSGMKYVYDSSLPAGSRLLSVRIGNEPLSPARTYTATVNEFVFSMLSAPQLGVSVVPDSETTLDVFEFSALRDLVMALGEVSYSGTNRVRALAYRGR